MQAGKICFKRQYGPFIMLLNIKRSNCSCEPFKKLCLQKYYNPYTIHVKDKNVGLFPLTFLKNYS